MSIKKIVNQRLDYTMSAVVGLAGLQPTIDAVKISKIVAIANKETIICGWEILSRLTKKYKTNINSLLKWVQDRDYGLRLWESGALALINISRCILEHKCHTKHNKIQKMMVRGVVGVYFV